MRNVAKGGRSG